MNSIKSREQQLVSADKPQTNRNQTLFDSYWFKQILDV